jgi:hypothetical protein
MFTTLKIAGLSALLSAGVVTVYSPASTASAPTQKAYVERLQDSAQGTTKAAAKPASADAAKANTKTDLAKASSDACSSQTWPYISRDCLVPAAGTPARKVARTVTMESRDLPNTSTLVRVATVSVATR